MRVCVFLCAYKYINVSLKLILFSLFFYFYFYIIFILYIRLYIEIEIYKMAAAAEILGINVLNHNNDVVDIASTCANKVVGIYFR